MKRNILCLLLVLSCLGMIAGCGKRTTIFEDNPAPGTSLQVTMTPSTGQINIPITTSIAATFNVPMDFTSVNNVTLVVTDQAGSQVAGTFTYAGTTATFTPASNLANNKTYTVSLSGALKGKQGGKLKPFSYTFTTVSTGDSTPPTLAEANYTSLNETQAGGPVFSYEDLSATGTDIPGLHVDDTATAVALPFSISLFGVPYSTIYVSTNGFFTVNAGDGTFANYPFPAVGDPRVAPYFDDLWPVAAPVGKILYEVRGTAPNRRLIVQWHNLEHFETRGDGHRIDFEVIMYENSSDILFQYLNTSSFLAGLANGASATVGLNKGDGVTASQYSFNTASLANGRAIRYSYAATNLSPAPGAINVPVTATVSAIFSEALSPVSIVSPATTFTVSSSGIPVDGAVTFNGVTATFSPAVNLQANTTYTATISTAVSDLNSNQLAAPITWTFITVP